MSVSFTFYEPSNSGARQSKKAKSKQESETHIYNVYLSISVKMNLSSFKDGSEISGSMI